MNVPQPGDWRTWDQIPDDCFGACHWSDFRERQVPPPPKFVNLMLPHGVWRYAERDPACPRHGDHGCIRQRERGAP